MTISLAKYAADLFPRIAEKVPNYFVGIDYTRDAICLRDSSGGTFVLFTRNEIDDNLVEILLDQRLDQIAVEGRFDHDWDTIAILSHSGMVR